MSAKIKLYSTIIENYEELITEIQNLYSDSADTKIQDNQDDKLLNIIREIIKSFVKDLQKKISKKHQKSSHLAHTMLTVFQEDNAPTYNLNQQIQILISCRKVLSQHISSLKYNEMTEYNITDSVWNLTDLAVLALCKKYETETTNKIRSNKNIIENLKIVKNDLQKQLNLTYQLIRNTPTGLAGCDPDLHIKLWNPIAETLTGYQQADIIGKSILSIFTASSQIEIRNQLSRELHRRKRMKLNIQTKEGGIFNAYVLINRLKSEIKQKIQYIINFIDLSKDEVLRSQVEKIEQLGAIARLSDAMMHDIRNPINSLALNIDVLTELLSRGSSFNEEMEEILEKINRQISNLTHNLNRYVGYSRITELKLEPTDIREPIDELILDKRYELSGKNITIKCSRSNSKLMIKGDRNQLIRVFRNLIDNAIDTIGDNGDIDIYLRKRNKNVIISIVDNGQGIQSENLQNVFKPYFTTKDKGSGLGLFIVREIVRAHHGKVYCTSSDDQGTRFTVSIPAIVE